MSKKSSQSKHYEITYPQSPLRIDFAMQMLRIYEMYYWCIADMLKIAIQHVKYMYIIYSYI